MGRGKACDLSRFRGPLSYETLNAAICQAALILVAVEKALSDDWLTNLGDFHWALADCADNRICVAGSAYGANG